MDGRDKDSIHVTSGVGNPAGDALGVTSESAAKNSYIDRPAPLLNYDLSPGPESPSSQKVNLIKQAYDQHRDLAGQHVTVFDKLVTQTQDFPTMPVQGEINLQGHRDRLESEAVRLEESVNLDKTQEHPDHVYED